MSGWLVDHQVFSVCWGFLVVSHRGTSWGTQFWVLFLFLMIFLLTVLFFCSLWILGSIRLGCTSEHHKFWLTCFNSAIPQCMEWCLHTVACCIGVNLQVLASILWRPLYTGVVIYCVMWVAFKIAICCTLHITFNNISCIFICVIM